MVRRSLFVACIAVILSLIIHGLALDLTTDERVETPSEDGTEEVDESSSTFEDLADVTTEVEEPPVTEPDPVEEAQEVEDNTSIALVESENPRNTLAPDTGDAEFTEPDAAENVIEAEEATQAEAEEVEAEPPALAAEAPETEPNDVEQAEAEPVEVETPQEVEPAEPEVVEAEPVTEPDAPLEIEPIETEVPDIVIAALPEDPETQPEEPSEALAAAAVTRSLRPPAERPEPQERTAAVTSPRGADGYIESPISAYQRTGVDLLSRSLSSSRSGASNFSGSRAVGNSNTTNYVGLVLVQLNRNPVRFNAGPGQAQVQFQIDPDGSLAWVRVLRSTGSGGVERAAAAQVRSAAPFPRPPSGKSQRLAFTYQSR